MSLYWFAMWKDVMRHFSNAAYDVFLSLKDFLKMSMITCMLWPATSIILKTSGWGTTSTKDVMRLLKWSKLTVGRKKPRHMDTWDFYLRKMVSGHRPGCFGCLGGSRVQAIRRHVGVDKKTFIKGFIKI